MHRNSQKRYYGKGIYFLTCNTQDKYPYFEHQILCEFRIEELKICKELKKFDIYAFCLNYDHFHVLLQPDEEVANISEIMRSLKTNSSRNINRIINNLSHEIPYFTQTRLDLTHARSHFTQAGSRFTQAGSRDPAFIDPNVLDLPTFQRQASFHDHFIRDTNDYKHHRYYTRDNYLKHDLPKDWKYHSGNVEYEYILDHIQV